MELCLITPPAHVDYTKLLPGRFCLAQVALRDQRYMNYFKEAARQGYKVILDNGAFEEDLISNQDYIDVAKEILPSILVLPDKINDDAKANLARAKSFIGQLPEDRLGCELMFVPQCRMNDDGGFEGALLEALDIAHDETLWIGINRNAVRAAFSQYTNTIDENVNKFFFGAWAEQKGILRHAMQKKNVRFHILGIGDRINFLSLFWWADSADTASLFYLSAFNRELQTKTHPHLSRPGDYFRRDFSPTEAWEETLKENCMRVSRFAGEASFLRKEIMGGKV